MKIKPLAIVFGLANLMFIASPASGAVLTTANTGVGGFNPLATFVNAADMNPGASAGPFAGYPITVQNVVFQAGTHSVAQNNFSNVGTGNYASLDGLITATYQNSAPYTEGAGPSLTGGSATNNTNLSNVLQHGLYSNASNGTNGEGPLVLTISGLTANATYQTDFFFVAGADGGRTQTLSLNGGSSTNISFGSSSANIFTYSVTANGSGIITASFDKGTGGGNDNFPILNAVAVTTAVPEPGTVALVTLGLMGVTVFRRRRTV